MTAARWVRSAVGGRQVAERAARITIGWLLRQGGAWPQNLWDHEGRQVARGPAWAPGVRSAGDWRLSAVSADLLVMAAAIEDDGLPAGDLHWSPCTPLDLLFAEALLALAERRGAGRRLGWPEALRAQSPLTPLWRGEFAGETALAGLQGLLAADWLWPFLEGHTIRRWLAIDLRRRHLNAAGHRALNEVRHAVHQAMWQGWSTRGRVDHDTLWARYYPRWLAQQGGVSGVLQQVRGSLEPDHSIRSREAYEMSFGQLLEPAIGLIERAAELRGYGWQRTPAESWFLGIYSREFEPQVDELRTLHDALCRII